MKIINDITPRMVFLLGLVLGIVFIFNYSYNGFEASKEITNCQYQNNPAIFGLYLIAVISIFMIRSWFYKNGKKDN